MKNFQKKMYVVKAINFRLFQTICCSYFEKTNKSKLQLPYYRYFIVSFSFFICQTALENTFLVFRFRLFNYPKNQYTFYMRFTSTNSSRNIRRATYRLQHHGNTAIKLLSNLYTCLDTMSPTAIVIFQSVIFL